MSAAAIVGDSLSGKDWRGLQAPTRLMTLLRYLLSGLLLSTFSARAEAPALSQEFWNYFVEFGDAQGELFDPSDYAAVANLPQGASQKVEGVKQDVEKSSDMKRLEQVPSGTGSTREQSQ
ncbi:MAG: hypothetical protein QM709_07125 [Spongiibacteraceae bacterium]